MNALGVDGENFAVQYLQRRGMTILNRNWRYGHKEVDIIAQDGKYVVFVEVKTRNMATSANDVITQSKMRFLVEAAEAYMVKYGREEEIRFDVMVLTVCCGGGYFVDYIPEAFR